MTVQEPINFTEYQLGTAETAIYPGAGEGGIAALTYLGLGLSSEAGEVTGKIKKIIRDSGGTITPEQESAIVDEVSDVFWYAVRIIDELGYSFEAVLEMNLSKLLDRKVRGVIGGSGDDR